MQENILENAPTIETISLEKDIDRIYESTPELSLIGTKEEYSQYLSTIFPESSIKEIVWHGSLDNITSDFKSNQHFGSFEAAKSRNEFKKQVMANMTMEEYYYPAVLDIKKAKRMEDADYAWDEKIGTAKEEGYDGIVYLNNNEGKNKDSYLVFDSNQIHILGAKADLDSFKGFVERSKVAKTEA